MKRLIGTLLLLGGLNATAQVQKIKITELEAIMQQSTGPVIVNMWATWCKPCIEEIPYFIEETGRHKSDSIRLLLVSLDDEALFPDNLEKFVSGRKFDKAEIFWLDETNADYFCPKVDPKWSGAIPATLFLNNKTGYRKFHEEQVSHEDLVKEIQKMLEWEG
jgi:thiol-disulfide isomerase/thioredoxin